MRDPIPNIEIPTGHVSVIKVKASLLVKKQLLFLHTVVWRAAVRRFVWKRWRLRRLRKPFPIVSFD